MSDVDEDDPLETLQFLFQRAHGRLRDSADAKATVETLAPEIDPRWVIDGETRSLSFGKDGTQLRSMDPDAIWNVIGAQPRSES